MPPGVVTPSRTSSARCFCTHCGVKTRCFTGKSVILQRKIDRLISESFLTVRGAALFLPRGSGSSPSSASRFAQLRSKHAGDLQQHLQTMFTVLRSEDSIKLAVRLESSQPQSTRYMVVVYTNGRQDTEESLVLGMDFTSTDSSCSVGLVLPLWSDTRIHLDGDGGFSVSTDNRIHVFKPVSVQAMWSALQSLHKACEVARCHNYFPGSLFLTWVSYYQSLLCSDQSHINEWNLMQDVQSYRADSPVLFSDVPTERARTERLIKTRLREIMMQKDLENVTSKEIRTELEEHMVCNLREFKEFIDNEMIVILGQMDSPTKIFDHVYLGSEWNASNLEELQNSGVQYILNVTREIDNFFPGVFEYHNIRVYDEEATDLLAYWNDTYKFINRAKKAGAKCLVHCKMGVSRSASTVIAYAMKEYGWDLERAFSYVKERRAVTKPNPSFMKQLEEYQGILLASKQRHNKLWRSHSDSDLSEHHEPLLKPAPQSHTLGRSDPRNQGNSPPAPSLEELLQPLPSGHTPSGPAPSTIDLLRADLSPPGPHSTAPQAVPPPSPPLSNGLCDSEGGVPALTEPPSPPPPRPRAATVIPEARKPDVSTVTVAEPVVVIQPHPPPSVHHLPPSPGPSPLPEDTLPLSALDTAHTPDPSPHIALPPGPPTPPPDSDQAQPPSGDPPSPPEGPPALSSDHINFFSAREMFQTLAQDGRGRGVSVQPAQQPASPRGPGQEPLPQEERAGMSGDDPREEGEESRKGSIISTQHVDPECTSAQEVHSVQSAALSLTPPPGSSSQSGLRGQEVKDSKEDVEERVVDSAEEVEDVKEEVKYKAEAMDASPSPLSCDWRRGSVRRVTRQLEQRMKQDHDAPCPSSSPPPLPLGPAAPQRRSLLPPPPPPSSTSPPTTPLLSESDSSNPLDAPLCPQELGVHTVQEEEEEEEDPGSCSPMEEVAGFSEDGGQTHKPKGASPPPHFRPPLHSFHDPLSSVDFLCLEGVTGEESGTDWAPRGDVIARLTWETLRELGAFLQQVSQPPWGGQDWGRIEGRGSRQRAREVEARIRQAGLTPPSLMKRSASLAKLGCLELLANDLSQWELSRPVPVAVKPLPHAATDESSKKQRVHRPWAPSESTPSDRPPSRTGPESSKHSHSPPSNQSTPPEVLPEPSPAPILIPLATRQQYGRTHPLRRLKKRSVSVLYHTM